MNIPEFLHKNLHISSMTHGNLYLFFQTCLLEIQACEVEQRLCKVVQPLEYDFSEIIVDYHLENHKFLTVKSRNNFSSLKI